MREKSNETEKTIKTHKMDTSLQTREANEQSKMNPEKTLILAKPDAVQRGLVGEIIKRFEQRGFKITAMKMINPTSEILGMHYEDNLEWKKDTGQRTIDTMAKKGIKMTETAEEIGDKVNLSAERVTYLLEISRHPMSVQQPISTEHQDVTLGDFIEDQQTLSPEESSIQTELRQTLETILSELPPREAEIVKLRFGYPHGEVESCENISKIYNVTPEWVRRLEKKALHKLRHPSRSRKLRNFLE